MLDKRLRKNIKKKKDGMAKLENKLNEIVGELNETQEVKQTR